MKAAFKNSISQQIARLLIVIFGLFILNNAVFLHAHQLSDGEIIVHAHPYNKGQDPGPFKTHPHTAAELFYIAHLQLLFFVFVTLSAAVFRIGNKRIYPYICPFLHLRYYVGSRGRSPPNLRRINLQPV